MIAPAFVDTNVLVYRHDASEPTKQARADQWYRSLWQRRCGRLSMQVLEELYAVLTRKVRFGVSAAEAQEIIRVLTAWSPVVTDFRLVQRAWNVQERYSLSGRDALIVAAAQTAECRVLLSEDLQHHQLLGSLRVVNPFASPDRTPLEILRGGR